MPAERVTGRVFTHSPCVGKKNAIGMRWIRIWVRIRIRVRVWVMIRVRVRVRVREG